MIVCWISSALWVADALDAPPAVRVATAFAGMWALSGYRVRRLGRRMVRRRREARAAGRGGRAARPDA